MNVDAFAQRMRKLERTEPDCRSPPVLERDQVRQSIAKRALPVTAILAGEQRRTRRGEPAVLQTGLRGALLHPLFMIETQADTVRVALERPSTEGIKVLRLIDLEDVPEP